MTEKQKEIIDTAESIGLKVGEISDSYHTFNELYEIRLAYNVALFNEWAANCIQVTEVKKKGEDLIYRKIEPTQVKYNVHKSWRHYEGDLCFGGDWFIVVANLPTGQISNHYHKTHWDKFKIPEVEKALYPFDGHSTKDVIERLINL